MRVFETHFLTNRWPKNLFLGIVFTVAITPGFILVCRIPAVHPNYCPKCQKYRISVSNYLTDVSYLKKPDLYENFDELGLLTEGLYCPGCR